jgi:hypothetical protein
MTASGRVLPDLIRSSSTPSKAPAIKKQNIFKKQVSINMILEMQRKIHFLY